MSLRRLLGLSAAAAAAVPGRLRRPLSTSGTPPPWAIIQRRTVAVEGTGAGAAVRLGHPPRLSSLGVPEHLIRTSAVPDADSDAIQYISGSVCSASSDGLLLLCYIDHRYEAPILAKRGAARLRKRPTELDPDHAPHVTHFVCNPVTGELSPLPDPRHPSFHPVCEVMCGVHVGLLTRAGTGSGHDGPPDRFAVAELHGNQMVRFLSETEEWETVAVSPCQFPLGRQMVLDDEVVAFGGRLWWLDVTCGAVSADPFSDRPELCFVELPRDSMLPAAAQHGCDCGEIHGCGISKHRRLCVSEGRLRYIEVAQEEPFLLSTFVLDDEGTRWTLQRRFDLSRLGSEKWCPHPWLPLKEGNTPQIGFLDPFNDNWVYMSATITTLEDTSRVVFVVDMKDDDVILSYAYGSDNPSFVPCVLPPWLGSSQIPSAGKKDVKKKQGLGLVRANSP